MKGGAIYDLNSEVIHRKNTIDHANSSFEVRKKSIPSVPIPPLDLTKLKQSDNYSKKRQQSIDAKTLDVTIV